MMIDTPGRPLGWAVTAYDFALIVLFHIWSFFDFLFFFLLKLRVCFPWLLLVLALQLGGARVAQRPRSKRFEKSVKLSKSCDAASFLGRNPFISSSL
jgi:hypothetical protein